jgi:RNA polymerase sigma factor (sigma-70 family)
MDPRDLLLANLRLVEGVVERVCRRARLHGAEEEDFASHVKLKLVEDDYAILRKYEGRSSLATYLRVVVERLLSDQRMKERGRWHPSAEAVRMGEAGVLLETLVRRDGRSVEAALPVVQAAHPSLGRRDVEAMLDRLPERHRRPRATDLESAPAARLTVVGTPESRVLATESRSLAARAAEAIRQTMESLAVEDRLLLRFRFGSSMSIADISRVLRLPQRPLYRRMEALLRQLREALAAAGVHGDAAADVLETAVSDDLDLGLARHDTEIPPIRQSEVVS